MDRLVTAHQEDLLTLDELRRRMPDLRQRENSLHAELQSIIDQVNDQTAYLRLAESLSALIGRLRASAETLDVHERQRIVRLLVKDVLVGDDTITIRHSIPNPSGPPNDGDPPTPRGGAQAPPDESYLLRSGRRHAPLWGSAESFQKYSVLLHGGCQPSFDVEQRPLTLHMLPNRLHQQIVREVVKQAFDVEVENPVVPPTPFTCDAYSIQRRFSRPVAIGVRQEDRIQLRLTQLLDYHLCDSIADSGHT